MLKDPLRRITVNAIEHAYFDAGHGVPIVMLHGWPEHSYCWRKLAAHLVPAHRTIALDFRGMGDSQIVPAGFDKKTLAGDVVGLMDRLGLERAVVAGHDWGAPVAYRVALDFPDRVSALVILNGRMPALKSHVELMYTPAQVRERWYFFFNLVPELPERVIGRSLEDYFAYLTKHWAGDGVSHDPADLRELVRVNGRTDGLRAGLGFYRTAVGADVSDWNAVAGRVIPQPNLVLWGAKDPVLPPVYLKGLEAVTPSLEVHINESAGHFLQEEAPAWCADHMRRFLARHEAELR